MNPYLLAGALIALLTAVYLLWPARSSRVATPTTRLDAAMPEWQFAELHSTRIRAGAATVEVGRASCRERVFRVV